jgi:hypothetical protein
LQLVENGTHLDPENVILSHFNEAHDLGPVNDVDGWMRSYQGAAGKTVTTCPDKKAAQYSACKQS